MELTFAGLPFPLRITPARPVTDEELLVFSAEQDGYQIERDSNGDLIVMTPAGSGSGFRSGEAYAELRTWAREDGRGIWFDSSSGFRLQDSSVLAADAAWVRNDRWNALTYDQQEGFAPLCPEFVIEVRSRTDSLPELQRKMTKWIANGAELAWLIDPYEKTVHVYHPDQPIEVMKTISQVSGEGPVRGFVLPLDRIFR